MAFCTITLAMNCGSVLLPYIIQNSKYGSDDANSKYNANSINKDLFYAMAGWIGLYTVGWMTMSYILVRMKHADSMKVNAIDYAHLEEDDDKYDIDITYDDAHKGKEHHHDISKIGVLHHRVDEDDEVNIESVGLLKNFTSMTSARGLVAKTFTDKKNSTHNNTGNSNNNPMHNNQGNETATRTTTSVFGVEML